MTHYRKKPVLVEAVRFLGLEVVENTGHNINFDLDYALPFWLREALIGDTLFTANDDDEHLFVDTTEGVMGAAPGDWIIRGVKGEIYPCKPDVFAMTYEPAPAPEPDFAGVAI
jgi:hypothetical protein